ncbi:MAG: S9 family peptidase [Deltaproteobacteria bacterium]|nr:S9 family peptidase [Deltaproteobacteria bacterium]
MKRALVVLAGLLAVLFVAAAGSAASVAGEKRTIAFEDVVRLKEPVGPSVSPDGSRLLFGLTGRDLQENRSTASVFMFDTKSRKMTQVTAGGKLENAPAWAPDGRHVVMLSDVACSSQLFVVDSQGEEAPKMITSLSSPVMPGRFSADGSTVFFTSLVFPGCADDACNRKRREAIDADPVKAQVFERLMYRHWDSWRDGTVEHLFSVPAGGGSAVDLMPDDSWGLTGSWSVTPDGTRAVYTTKDPLDETLNTNHQVAVLDVAGRKTSVVTENRGYDGGPVVSPDGQWVAWASQQRPGFESDRMRLSVQRMGGAGGVLYPSNEIDHWAWEFGWFPDGSELWFLVPEQGRTAIYRVDMQGRSKPKKIVDGQTLSAVTLSPDGKWFYAVRQSLSEPSEIWKFPSRGGVASAVTSINSWFAQEVRTASVEEVWWEGAGGAKIHGFVLFPPGTSKSKKNPLLVLIHGGPQGMWADQMHPRWNAQLFAAPGYVTFLPNIRGSIGFGQQFVDEISRDWGGKAFEDLMLGVDFLIKKGWVDPDRLAAGGGSYGGYLANWLEARTDRFKCLFSHAGVYDLNSKYGTTDELWFPEWEFGGTPWTSEDYTKWSPSSYVKDFKTPMLVIHGAYDFRVCENQAMQLFTALQRQGVPSKFLYFPDESHFVAKPRNSQLWYRTIHEWLAQWLNAE